MSAARAMRRAVYMTGAVVACALGFVSAAAAAAATPDSWRPAAPMGTARLFNVGVPLPGDKLLVTGGMDPLANALKSTEIYAAAADSWTGAHDMGTARVSAAAVALLSGKVLVVGGSTSSSPTNALSSGEVYDPALNTWTNVLGAMSSTRTNATATLLTNGQVLIAGGTDATDHPVATSDLYDPFHNTFSPTTGPMGTPRALAAATLLAGGKVLVAGGQTTATDLTPSAETYDPGTGTWTAVVNTMSDPRAYASAIALPDGKVLIGGGESARGTATTASTDFYDPATNRFSPGPAMNVPRAGFGLTSLPGGQALVLGGFFITGGNDNVDPKAQFYNPSTNAWASLAPMPLAKTLGTATRLTNGDILWAGGSNDVGETGVKDTELYTPPALPDAPTSVSATPANGSATVVFAAPASDGGLPVLHYTVKASTGQLATTPDARTFATVSGLTNGKPVTFTVTATTALGSGGVSGASAR